MLTSSALEEVVDIVRFLIPFSADTDIVDGRENVTLVVRIDPLESLRVIGKGLSSSIVTAVVGVGLEGAMGLAEPRTVDIDATEGLWRVVLLMVVDVRRSIDSEGREGRGGGTDRGGRVRARLRFELLCRAPGVGEGS